MDTLNLWHDFIVKNTGNFKDDVPVKLEIRPSGNIGVEFRSGGTQLFATYELSLAFVKNFIDDYNIKYAEKKGDHCG